MPAPAPRARQQGVALLFILILIGMAGAFFLVVAMNKSASSLALARDQKTQVALDRAKQALLTFAATEYAENAMSSITHGPNKGVPGYLPCPDRGPLNSPPAPEGTSSGNCDTPLVSMIGKLPWNTLGIEPLRDGSGECLWYAVSGTYKYHFNGVTLDTTTSNMMNWDTPGLFDVLDANGNLLAGGSPPARAVAAIFAPGPELAGQDRSNAGGTTNCGGNYTASNYLETANGVNNSAASTAANAVTKFIAGQASNTFNDRLVYITRDELWAAIKKVPDPSGVYSNLLLVKLNTMTQNVAKCIAKYGTQNNSPSNQHLLWAAPLSQSNYAIDFLYDDNSGEMFGRVPYLVDRSDNDSNNKIGNPYYLFGTGSYCYTGPGAVLDDHDINWYSNWKDHLFYVVSDRFKPATGSVPGCTSTRCVKVNSGTLDAAIVMFAGERLAGQTRDTNADRANIANYLEGSNASNYPDSGGDNNYQSGAPSATFNDVLYCIRENLSVVQCP